MPGGQGQVRLPADVRLVSANAIAYSPEVDNECHLAACACLAAFEKAFPLTPINAPASCELAFEQATFKPRWHVNDDAEVAFKGKGFEGSWAAATVVKPDGRNHVLVRYAEFVDNDGTPLVEQGTWRGAVRACARCLPCAARRPTRR